MTQTSLDDDGGDGEIKSTSVAARMQALRRRHLKKTIQAKEGDDMKEKETDKVETPSGDAQTKDTVEDTAKTAETAASLEPKKKYKGVAKMRREMIKKKEKEAAQAKEEESKAVSTAVPLVRKSSRLTHSNHVSSHCGSAAVSCWS